MKTVRKPAGSFLTVLSLIIAYLAATTTGCGLKIGNQDPEGGTVPGPSSETARQLSGCKLDQPLNIGEDSLLRREIQLLDPRFDQLIKTDELRAMGKPVLRLYEIQAGTWREPVGTGFLGVDVGSLGDDGSLRGVPVGFANRYEGDIHIRGDKETTNGVTVYHTLDQAPAREGDDPSREPARTEVIAVLDGMRLMALQLTLPIEQGSDGSYRYTGKNQVLCLKSARLK